MDILRARPEVLLLLFMLGMVAVQPVRAVTAEIIVHTPNAGQVYSTSEPIVVVYTAERGARGDHINVYVDEGRAMMVRRTPGEYLITRASGAPIITAVIRDLSGHFNLGTLMPGHHLLTLEIVDRRGEPVGAMATVAILVQ